MNVVCRLGGFHLLMSFLGSIGQLMGGSGMDQLLEQIYAGNVIHHILSGKAFSRALHGHLLVHTVLQTLMVEDLLENCRISTEDLDLLAAFESQDNITDEMHVAFKKVQSEVADWKAMFKDDPTATLWINYMGYVDIVKRYIRAENT